MAILMHRLIQAKKVPRRSFSNERSTLTDIPKGYLAVYVGVEDKKRFIVPVSVLSQSSFQGLLRKFEKEFGYEYPMGGLTIPCNEDIFIEVAYRLL